MQLARTTSFTQRAIDSLHQSLPLVKHKPKPLIETELTNSRKAEDSVDKAEIINLFKKEMRPMAKFLSFVADLDISQDRVNAMNSLITIAYSLQELTTTFSKITGQFFFPFCKMLIEKTNQLSENFLYDFARRMNKIRPPVRGKIPDHPNLKQQLGVLKRTLEFGISNAAHTAWSLIAIIPTVFFNQNGRLPNPDEYKEIAQSIKPLIKALRSGEDQVFTTLGIYLRREHTITDSSLPIADPRIHQLIEYQRPYHPEDFQIINSKLELAAEVVDSVHEQLQEKLTKGEIDISSSRIGCPAGAFIEIIIQWCLKAAELTMFKNPEKIHSFCDPRNNRGYFPPEVEVRDHIIIPGEDPIPRSQKNLFIPEHYPIKSTCS